MHNLHEGFECNDTTPLKTELAHNRQRLEETSEALKVAHGKEKETLEILMDALQDNEDFILQEIAVTSR